MVHTVKIEIQGIFKQREQLDAKFCRNLCSLHFEVIPI